MNVLTALFCVNRSHRKDFYRQLGRPGFLRLMMVLFIALVWVGSVSAQGRIGFQVNSTRDEADAFPGNGVCETASGNGICTLRAAIHEGNANTNTGVSISFNIPTSDLGYNAQTGAWTISVFTVLEIGKAARLELPTLSINGPGADKLIIDGGASRFGTRVFNVTTPGKSASQRSRLRTVIHRAAHTEPAFRT